MKSDIMGMYCPPEAKIFEVRTEGVICQSGRAGVQDYGWNEYVEE